MFFTAATAVCWIQACHQSQTHVSYLPDPLWMNSRVYQMIYSSVSPSWPAQQHRGLMYICSISFIIINISYTIIPEMKYGYSHHPTCCTCQYTETHVCTYENNIRALHCCNMKLGFTASAALLFKRSGSFSCLLLVLWCCSFTNAHSKAASHFFVRLHQQVEVGGPLDLHSQESDWHLWLYNIHKSLQRPFCDITVKGLWRQQEDHPHLNYTAHLWLNNINLRLV